MPSADFLVSFPKSGNTWLRTIIASYQRGGTTPNLNHLVITTGIAAIIPEIDPGIDVSDLTLDEVFRLRPWATRQIIRCRPGYIFKSHDALLPPAPGLPPSLPLDALRRVVYVVRDPRDVAVSYAAHMGISLDEAILAIADPTLTLSNRKDYARRHLPQFLSSWSAHVESWLDSPVKLLPLRYEDMIADPIPVFGDMFKFLGLNCDAPMLARCIEATRFDALRTAEDATGFRERLASRFFRRGVAGGWRDSLSGEQIRRIEGDHQAGMRRMGYL